MPRETKPTGWTFGAICHTCGVTVPAAKIKDEYREVGDTIEYVVILDKVDIEAHLLTHQMEQP
jgi:hypothetical protein